MNPENIKYEDPSHLFMKTKILGVEPQAKGTEPYIPKT